MKYALGNRSKSNLVGVNADLARVVNRAIEITETDFTVIEGLRTKERQAQLFKEGKTRTMNSRHIIGQAVDVVPYPVDWNDTARFRLVAKAMKQAAKELVEKETGNWAVKCVGTTSGTGTFSQSYNQFLLERTQGVSATFMARIKTPSANGTINAGRVDVTTSLGSITVDPYPEVFDGWTWMLVTVPSSLLDGATTFKVSIFTGNNTDVLYIDRVSLVEGRTPYDSYYESVTLSDYYDPSNALSYLSNVITVTDDSVTLESTSEAFPSWYLNVYGLVANETYTMTWTSTSASGTVLARADLDDAGAALASVSPLNTNTITWRPTKSTGSLQISNSAGTEPFTLDSIKIVKG